MKLHLDTEIGQELPFAKLVDSYDAVFLGVGATNGKRAGIPNEDHEHCFLAMEYLTNVQRRLGDRAWMERFGVLGKRVVVIGGGDTAMDCVRTAVREGAQEVTCLYRRDETNMPGSRKEYHNAVEEGVTFLFQAAPQRIVVDGYGRLVGVDAIRTLLGEPDVGGRQRVEELPGSEHCVAADVVIMALGFDIAGLPWLRETGIELGRWGEVLIEPVTGRSSHPKVYAGGDCQRGADLVVTAAADGRRAALAIMEQLLG
jgi:glutamate synthase (NADPH/NADH) small chain